MKGMLTIAMSIGVIIVGMNVYSGECKQKTSGKKLSCEERRKQHNVKSAEKYRKYANDNKNSKMSKCDENASDEVKNAARKEIGLRHDFGKILEKLANAYEQNEPETIKKLHSEKWEMERKIDLARRKKRIVANLSAFAEKIEKFPDSEKLADLKKQVEDTSEKYMKLSSEIIDKEKERMNLENQLKKYRTDFATEYYQEKKKECRRGKVKKK